MSGRLSRWMMMGALVVSSFAISSQAQADGSIAGAVAAKYSVTALPVAAAKGQPTKAAVVVKPSAGYHMNEEFPTKLSLKPTAGVTVAKAELLGKGDAKLSKEECRFEVTLTGTEAGKKMVTGDLKFAVCTETTCEPQKTVVSIELNVK